MKKSELRKIIQEEYQKIIVEINPINKQQRANRDKVIADNRKKIKELVKKKKDIETQLHYYRQQIQYMYQINKGAFKQK